MSSNRSPRAGECHLRDDHEQGRGARSSALETRTHRLPALHGQGFGIAADRTILQILSRSDRTAKPEFAQTHCAETMAEFQGLLLALEQGWELDGGNHRTGPCPDHEFVVGMGHGSPVLIRRRDCFPRYIDVGSLMSPVNGYSVELSSMSKTLPVRRLTAQVERQTTDAVVGEIVVQQNRDLGVPVQFTCP